MMGGEWKSAFSDADLENGLELALTGAVSVLDDAPETVIASIKDADMTYRVFVRLKKGWPHVYCGCEIGRMGNTCAHAAAALFVHDGVRPETTVADKKKAAKNAVAKTTAVKKKAASAEEKKQPKPVYVPSKELFCPVKTDDDGDFRSNYQYFHLDVITKDLLFRKDVVEKARELVEADGVFLRNIQVGFATAGSDAIAEAAGGAVYGKTEYFVGCEFGRTRVFWMNCMVPECRKKYAAAAGNGAKSPCPHCTALLMRVYDNIGRGDFIVDASNSEGIHFLDAFKDKIRKDVAKGSDAVKDVVIEPRLEYDGWDLELGFRIGIDKMYVVKGIRQLVDTIENKGVLKLGKKTEISFVLHALTEESERYFALMREYVEELEFGYKDSFYSPGERSTIPLHGRILDACYDMLFGHTVAFKGYYEKEKPIAVGESDYRPKLSLSAMGKNKKSFEGIRLSGRVPNMIEGIGRYYILTDKMLGHVSDRLADILLPFVKSGEYEDSNICIGRKHLGEFYNDILPRLGEYCDIEMHDEALIAPFVPPDAEFTFYLDAPEGNITMRAQVAYEDTVFPLLPKEEKADAFRDRISEAQVRSLVQELFPEYDEKAGEYSAQADADTVYHILEYGVGELMSNGIVEATDRFLRLKINRSMKINLGISLSANLLTLDVSSDELSHEELLELLYSYRAKKKFHRLKNGDFISFEESNTEVLSVLLDEMGVSPKEFVKGKMHLPAYRALYMDHMLEEHEEIVTNRDNHFKNIVRNMTTIRNAEIHPPAKQKSVLRNYQLYGFRFLYVLTESGFGGILADDMGLGKTLQVLTLLSYAKENAKKGTSLVICPASLVYNWKEEADRFAPSLKVGLLAGAPQERQEMLAHFEEYDLLITSYHLLHRDIEHYEGISFAYHILDEAQFVKNAQTAAAKAVRLVASDHRLALTGTPIENRLSELWSIFDFLMPGFLYGYEEFKRRFERPIVTYKDEAASKQLRNMISPFVLRRLKGNVLKDLPDKLEENRTVSLGDTQRKLYDAQVVHLKQMLAATGDEEFAKNKIVVLSEITKLRQLCCDPALLYEDYKGECAKREALMELVHTAMDGDHKILIFSQFTTMLERIMEDLAQEGISYYTIMGKTPKKERMRLVNDFNANDVPVFLISLKAGGTGLNLTGADIVIHYDPWWNYAVQNQATDRAHRIGQTNVVSVFKLIAKDTIEEKISRLQETKKELADEILSGEGGNLTKMTKDELLALLG